ncbi:type II toxin-antitoxin system VapC family toxin [Microbacterium thalassium]|uniref:Ribonuclease VapC n=1 Tax=Microbacterium thalassium TaxID=362649 RepID=A0A7X0FS60_9MICO|nr:PIN domain-containing protein [Microbacterium thalassium]MBB6392743.1 putative nucleic acid-binding protein [Microbacterium thalassium]GLK23025.1 ribonuclease VapC32 [Microbacterium thalassium]
MILVDTAVWIDHLHRSEPVLETLLHANNVCVHPLVIAELALGRIAHRDEVIEHLHRMPRAAGATDAELLAFIESRDLAGRGLSAVDAHLLASATLTPGTSLWTRDRRLAEAARGLGVGWQAPST